MPLSENEQRLLEQMERALYAEDPKWASAMRGAVRRSSSARRLLLGIVGVVVGLVLLLVGVAGQQVIVGIVGFLVMLAAFAYTVSSRKKPGPTGVVNRAGTAGVAKLPVDGVLLAGKTGTAQVRRISMAERNSGGVRSNESLAWKMRDHSLFVGFAPADKPRYACAVIVEHGGWGASVAAPACRDVLTYLFDKDKAMAALTALEEQWGGTIADRMRRRAEKWVPPEKPAKPAEPEQSDKAAAEGKASNPRKAPTKTI